jgi:hypothetical protein
MSPTLPPIVSEKQLIAHVNVYINTKRQDKNWRSLFDLRFKLIGEHYATDTYLHWPLMRIWWWDMGHSKLINTHKRLVSQGLRKAEDEIGGLHKALSAARAEVATSLTSTSSPKNEEVLTSNDASTTLPPESSDVNSFNFPRNDNSINTEALPMVEKDSTVGSSPSSLPKDETTDPSLSRTQASSSSRNEAR